MGYTEQKTGLIIDLVIGSILGGIDAAANRSSASNLLGSVFVGTVGNAVGSFFNRDHKFLSRETALSTLTITASSGVVHLIGRALIGQHHEPKITYAPDCGCKWQHKVSEEKTLRDNAKMR